MSSKNHVGAHDKCVHWPLKGDVCGVSGSDSEFQHHFQAQPSFATVYFQQSGKRLLYHDSAVLAYRACLGLHHVAPTAPHVIALRRSGLAIDFAHSHNNNVRLLILFTALLLFYSSRYTLAIYHIAIHCALNYSWSATSTLSTRLPCIGQTWHLYEACFHH